MSFQELQRLQRLVQGKTARTASQVGNFLGNPFPEYGVTERAEARGAAALPEQQQIARVANDPRFNNLPYGPTQQYYPRASSVPNQPGFRGGSVQGITDTPPPGKDIINNGNGGGGAGGGNPGNPGNPNPFDTGAFERNVQSQRDLARSTYEEGKRQAGDAFNRARGIYDEGVGLLGQRKQEFQKLFSEGQDNILNRYESERGNLQAASQGAETRSANSLRALGLGGSAAIKSQGRLAQQNARAAGELATQKDQNESANTGVFNERQTWANTQDSALQRSLQDAYDQRTAAENQAGLVERGDYQGIQQNVDGFLQNLSNQQASLAASRQGIGGYTANPTSINFADLTGGLQAVAPQLGGGAQSETDVNIQEQDNSIQARLKRLLGGR